MHSWQKVWCRTRAELAIATRMIAALARFALTASLALAVIPNFRPLSDNTLFRSEGFVPGFILHWLDSETICKIILTQDSEKRTHLTPSHIFVSCSALVVFSFSVFFFILFFISSSDYSISDLQQYLLHRNPEEFPSAVFPVFRIPLESPLADSLLMQQCWALKFLERFIFLGRPLAYTRVYLHSHELNVDEKAQTKRLHVSLTLSVLLTPSIACEWKHDSRRCGEPIFHSVHRRCHFRRLPIHLIRVLSKKKI